MKLNMFFQKKLAAGNILHQTLFVFLVGGLLVMPVSAQRTVSIGEFQQVDVIPDEWQVVQYSKSFPPTKYSLKKEQDNISIYAEANGASALLIRNVDVDLRTYPVLCWRWKVHNKLKNADMRSKMLEDYAARIYISFDIPKKDIPRKERLMLKIKRKLFTQNIPDGVMQYVWDNKYPEETTANNIYNKRAKMYVLRSLNTPTNQWQHEKQNIVRDIRKLFELEEFKISQIGIITDSDNTGESVSAEYADIHFVTARDSCQF